MLTHLLLPNYKALGSMYGQRMQLPLQPKDGFNDVESRSSFILDAWCQPIPVDRDLRVNDLQAVIEAPLPKPIPSAFSITSDDKPVNDVLSFQDQEVRVNPPLTKIMATIHYCPKFGENEDSVHSLVDQLVLTPMDLVGRAMDCKFRFNRNGADSTGATIRMLRPDVLAWLPSGILAFKGEEKATVEDLGAAKAELLSKLSCFSDAYFGSLPYQICFVAGGFDLEFMAINRVSGGQPQLESISSVIHLDTIRGRSFCIRYAVNVARILVWSQKKYPHGTVVNILGSKIITSASEVEIMGEYVIKKTNQYTGNVLKKLYREIQKCQPPHLVSLLEKSQWSRSRSGQLTLKITPVGYCGARPNSIDKMKRASQSVLTALSWLHDHGWVHRDIRAPNIMLANNVWYLMDLEWANTINLGMGNYNPRESYRPPELVGIEKGKWTGACDMWQFGKLLEFWNVRNERISGYIRIQVKEDPEQRLSASESLQEFFASNDGE